MKKTNRIGALAVLCALLLALTLPVGAVSSSFSDIHDDTTAVNAEVLRLMGVVSGSGNNTFSPNDSLTRAQFCVMAVNVMGRGDEAATHTTRTIFSDVTARHWARGFINLASSITVGGDNGGRLISGSGTGAFLPDDPITYAQAVTILMRMLDYTDKHTGGVWPAGYLNLAASIGLTDGVKLSPSAPITRGQAAQLFVNLLTAKTAQGQKYAASLGTASENVILLAVNVKGDDGRPGAVRTSKGVFHPANPGSLPAALQGRRGTLITNDRNELLTFIPDNSTSLSVILSGDARATGFTASTGKRYTIDASTPAYTSDQTGDTTWGQLWMDVHTNAQVTLFLDGGKVIGVYYAAAGQIIEKALIASDEVNRATFHTLTGGIEDYTITKHGQSVGFNDIKPYDVVTYDSAANTLIVSDLRLTCVYENAAPNPQTPDTIHALGHDFPVLDSAIDTVSQFSVGKTATLLLTADGQVAGMVQSGPSVSSTAIGLAKGSSVEMFLPNGGSIELKSSEAFSQNKQDQLVSVSSGNVGVINAIPLRSRTSSKDFDLDSMKLGSYTVAAGVRVFERYSQGAVVPIALADLDTRLVPADQISGFHVNTSNMVDILVLTNTTGDSYRYGRYLVTVYTVPEYDDKGNVVGETERRDVTFEDSTGSTELPYVGFSGKSGTFVGMAADSQHRPLSTITLRNLDTVHRGAFFRSHDRWYVTVNKVTYELAEDVQAFNRDTGSWFTGEDVLSDVRAYSDKLTLYADPIGNKIRIITANEK